jgi:hypothetical protein
MKMPKIIAMLLVGVAYLESGVTIAQEANTEISDLPPPWASPAVTERIVPKVYVSEWKKAENRDRCQLLVLFGAERKPGVKIRRAEFSGGWAVAYDLPGQRSAYGVAGTGVDLDQNNSTFKFPHSIAWADGSSVNYGLEGGTGPGYLAYLKVSGQSCLYNIWSKRSKTDLEHLIWSLRQVKVRP